MSYLYLCHPPLNSPFYILTRVSQPFSTLILGELTLQPSSPCLRAFHSSSVPGSRHVWVQSEVALPLGAFQVPSFTAGEDVNWCSPPSPQRTKDRTTELAQPHHSWEQAWRNNRPHTTVAPTQLWLLWHQSQVLRCGASLGVHQQTSGWRKCGFFQPRGQKFLKNLSTQPQWTTKRCHTGGGSRMG